MHFEGHVSKKNKKSYIFDRIHYWDDSRSTDSNLYNFEIAKYRPFKNRNVKEDDSVLFDGIIKEGNNEVSIEEIVILAKAKGPEFQSDAESVKQGKPLLSCKCKYEFKCDMFSCPFC